MEIKNLKESDLKVYNTMVDVYTSPGEKPKSLSSMLKVVSGILNLSLNQVKHIYTSKIVKNNPWIADSFVFEKSIVPWTVEEEETLLQRMNNMKSGERAIDIFKEISQKINRTPSAICYHWYKNLNPKIKSQEKQKLESVSKTDSSFEKSNPIPDEFKTFANKFQSIINQNVALKENNHFLEQKLKTIELSLEQEKEEKLKLMKEVAELKSELQEFELGQKVVTFIKNELRKNGDLPPLSRYSINNKGELLKVQND